MTDARRFMVVAGMALALSGSTAQAQRDLKTIPADRP